MKYRKLRIAWSILCGVVCLLLLALWVRSYWWYDTFSVRTGKIHVHLVQSLHGELSWIGPGALEKGSKFLNWRATPAEGWWSPPTMQPFLGFHWTTVGPPRPVIPYWFPVLMFAGLGAMSWLQWRFSLRRMFAATALAATLLGAVSIFISRRPSPQPISPTTPPGALDDLFQPGPFDDDPFK